jgi:hypothetical protein
MKLISLLRLPGSTASSDAVAGAERLAAGHQPSAFQGGMADEHRLQPVLLEELRFKRQQRQHQVEIIRHGLGASGTRRPDLRRHVVDGDDARGDALQPLGDQVGEIRAVDPHHGIGPGFGRIGRRAPHPAQDFGNFGNDLAQAHHRGGVERKKAFQPFRRHGIAADAGDVHGTAGELLQRRHQLGPEAVAGGLAADQHQGERLVTHGRAVLRDALSPSS